MQQATTQETEYAHLGWRFAAVLIDGAVLFGALVVVMTVYLLVLVSQGKMDLNDPAAAQLLIDESGATSDWVANAVFFAALFVYYTVLEGFCGASIGKLALRMRVVMVDGSRPTGAAILVRNLLRLLEAALFYIPAAISCLASERRQRLGDMAARTVVVRRRAPGVRAAPSGPYAPQSSPYAPPAYGPPSPPQGGPSAGPPAWPPAAGPAAGGPAAWQPEAPAPEAPPAATAPAGGWEAPAVAPAPGATPAHEAPALDDALGRLKTAALAVRGAHLAYLHFSERELSTQSAQPDPQGADLQGASGARAAESDPQGADTTPSYSEEYVGAWFTLADAVAAFQRAHNAATAAATAAGRTLDDACAPQADLVHLLRGLTPYLPAATDEQVHEAFLSVARAELPPS